MTSFFSSKYSFVYLILIWLICIILTSYLSTFFIKDFGGRFPYYQSALVTTGLPNWIWGFGNFDGVHYLRIAMSGYDSDLSQAFFPFYPLLIRFVSLVGISSNENLALFLSGILISLVSFFGAFYYLYKLFKIDYPNQIVIKALILLLLFPTAFYFVSIYTESLFLLLATASIYYLRKEKYLIGGALGLAASLTRIYGFLLVVLFVTELVLKYKRKELNKGAMTELILSSLLPFFGMIFYMFFLYINYGDFLYFLNAQSQFGAGRSSSQIFLLPQVIFRYLKIFLTTPIFSLPFFNSFLEFIFTIVPVAILILGYKKIRISYLVFTGCCLILPTLTGTLSSMPRYVLLSFLILPFIVTLIKNNKLFVGVTSISFILQLILLSMFIRGYWVA